MSRSQRRLIACALVAGMVWGCGQVLDLERYDLPADASVTTSAAGGSGGHGAGGSGGAGGGVGGRCGGLGVLADDFGDGEPTPNWRDEMTFNSTVLENAGEARMWVPALVGGGRAQRTTQHFHDLRDDYVMIEVTEVPSEGQAMLEVRDALLGDDWLQIAADAETLHFRSSMNFDIGSIPFDMTLHRFWRIIEEGGGVRLETSPTGTNDWTSQTSVQLSSLLRSPYVLVTFGLEASNALNGQAAGFKNLNGGVARQSWCKAETLKDAFDDGIIADQWVETDVASCSVDEVDGDLTMTLLSPGYCEYLTGQAFDLVDSSLTLRIRSANSPAYQHYITLFSAQNDWFDVTADGNMLLLDEVVGGMRFTRNSITLPDDEWWRISASAGELFFQSSPDGNNWSSPISASTSIPLDAVQVGIGISEDVEGGDAIFSALNVVDP